MSVRKGLPENVTIPPITIAEGDKSAEMEVTAAAGAELKDSTVDLLATGRCASCCATRPASSCRSSRARDAPGGRPVRARRDRQHGVRHQGGARRLLNLVKEMDDKKFDSRIDHIAYRNHKSEHEEQAS